ncbi:helix-turn-helix domain-containing protein [Sphaerisporangium corydalis]|uniref:Helix-turn-helix domain-containing protein n=1 Tax=Sphaerisporangium corydalis TaxID=1441875 RepID=A0ABV9EKC1_9ACTN|nr:helix-turn-helix transcriptional regulator [Sphaerisporangium corydalis]
MAPHEADADNAAGTRYSSAVLRMVLGQQLRRMREERGISRETAGYVIRASDSKIGRLELGRSSFKPRDVADLLTLYGVTDDRDREALLDIAARANRPGWWHRFNDVLPPGLGSYLGLEDASSVIRAYEVHGVHDLLQTEEYAHRRFGLLDPEAPPGRVERRVEMQMTRQKVLTRPGPATLWLVMDAAALWRSPGDRDLTRAQIRHLIEMSQLPNVALQIVPFGTYVTPGLPFSMLRFHAKELPDVVYVQHLTGALLLDKPDDVMGYLDVMDSLSVAAIGPDFAADVLHDILKEM